jgi:hypothetical protein
MNTPQTGISATLQRALRPGALALAALLTLAFAAPAELSAQERTPSGVSARKVDQAGQSKKKKKKKTTKKKKKKKNSILGSYITVGLGASVPTDSPGGITLEQGWASRFGFGYRLSKQIALEGAILYRVYDFSDGSSNNNNNNDENANSASLFGASGTFRFFLPQVSRDFDMYTDLGLVFMSFSGLPDDTEISSLAAEVGGGLDFRLGSGFSLGGRFTYIGGLSSLLGGLGGITGTNTGNGDTTNADDVGFGDLGVMLTATFKLGGGGSSAKRLR